MVNALQGIRMQKVQKPVCFLTGRFFLICVGLITVPGRTLLAQNKAGGIKLLQNVTVTGEKKQNSFTAIVPVQLLDHEAIQQINAETIAGAAKYFSGFIKDYGGIGGLKRYPWEALVD
jgi:hypothetical protein